MDEIVRAAEALLIVAQLEEHKMAKETMTERAYIIATDLARLRDVLKLLSDVHPSVNEFIDENEYLWVRKYVNRWLDRIDNSFECIEETNARQA